MRKTVILGLIKCLTDNLRLTPPRKQALRDAYYAVAWSRHEAKFQEYWKTQKGKKAGLEMAKERNDFMAEELGKESASFHEALKERVEIKYKQDTATWEKQLASVSTDNSTGGEK
jgi:hypothetical protein